MTSAMIYLRTIKSTLNNITTNYSTINKLVTSLLNTKTDYLTNYNLQVTSEFILKH